MLPYAPSLIDRLYDERDLIALDGVIALIEQSRSLPEQFWLFWRLLAWRGWTRSGIWQYYDAIAPKDFEAIASSLERAGLHEIASRYRTGMSMWQSVENCDDLDRWIDSPDDHIETAAFALIESHREHLYPTEQ